ncbi:MAG: ribonuclease P protein component 1 [Candidatus Bathyarchaeia archaeon]
MITPYTVLKHELIGLQAKVDSSRDPTLLGLEGEIVDETRNTLTLETRGGRKMIPKDVVSLKIALPSGQTVRVKGDLLVGRPEERIKQHRRVW